MKEILISGGQVIDPSQGLDAQRELRIRDGRIEAIAPPGAIRAAPGGLEIDARGCWLLPGLIDPHVHLRDPGFAQKETIASGLRAAAAGGFTAVAAMANTAPVNDRPEITRYMLEQARATRAARLVVVSAVSRGLLGAEAVDFAAMAEAGARMFSDDGMPIDNEIVLARALEEVDRLGFAVSLHEEDRSLVPGGAVNEGEVSRRLGVPGIPAAAEARRVRRDLALAMGTEAAVHLAHVSSAETVELVRAARRNGIKVTCEIAPHHFAIDERAVLRWGPNAKMNPPLRSAAQVEVLRAAIAEGSIDMIASDHAPHDPDSKQLAVLACCFPRQGQAGPLSAAQGAALARAANGVVGLETALGVALGLVHDSIVSPGRLAEMMSTNPARLLRLEAGGLAPGAIADVTVVDPDLRWRVDPARFLSRSRNTPFAGMELRGKAILTLVGGEIVYDGRPVPAP